VFRLSAELTEPVDPKILQAAADAVLPRFPSFRVRLARGAFWYYLEQQNKPFRIEEDIHPGCRRIMKDDFLFRVSFRDAWIALEVFHAVTDGAGALVFLKTLIAEYLEQLHPGLKIPPEHGVKDRGELPHEGELEDSFRRHYRVKPRRQSLGLRSFRLKGSPLPNKESSQITGILSTDALKTRCAEAGVRVSEYLSAVYLYALAEVQKAQGRSRKPVRLSLPVDLRKYYGSRTLRNFTLYITPGIEPQLGEYSFEEILHQVHHLMRYELNTKYLSEVFSSHVSFERNMLIRLLPLSVKNRMISLGYGRIGKKRVSGSLSNLGQVELPEAMAPYIRRFGFQLGANGSIRTNCAVISYGKTTSVTFTRTIRQTEAEGEFFRFLVKQGIGVSVFPHGQVASPR